LWTLIALIYLFRWLMVGSHSDDLFGFFGISAGGSGLLENLARLLVLGA
jgi:hypothetical protein